MGISLSLPSDGGERLWSQRLAQVSGELTQAEANFVDVIAASIDSGFEEIFGADRVLPYLALTLSLAKELNERRFAFEISLDDANPDELGEGLSRISLDIASIDQVYLVDSFLALLARFEISPSFSLHPLVTVDRSSDGSILSAKRTGVKHAQGRLESYIHFDVVCKLREISLESLRKQLEELFEYLETIFVDHKFLDEQGSRVSRTLSNLSNKGESFTVLGARIGGYDFGILRRLPEVSLQLVRDSYASDSVRPHLMSLASPVLSNEALVVLSGLGEPPLFDSHSDYVVGIPTCLGEARNSLSKDALNEFCDLLAIPSESYSFRELGELLSAIPAFEFELLQVPALETVISSLLLARETNQISSFISSLCSEEALRIYLFVPMSRYRAGMARAIEKMLIEDSDGVTVLCREARIDSRAARIDVDFISTDATEMASMLKSRVELLHGVATAVARTWTDRVAEIVELRHGARVAQEISRRYRGAFDSAYQNDYGPGIGADDIDRIESAINTDTVWVGFTSEIDRKPLYELLPRAGGIRLRIIHLGERRKLSSLLPLVETFGISVVDEIPYELHSPESSGSVWLYDFGVEIGIKSERIDHEYLLAFGQAFSEVFLGDLDADYLNSLVLNAGLNANGIVLLRTLAHYQRFCVGGASVTLAVTIISSYPLVARALVEYFRTRFSMDSTEAIVSTCRNEVFEMIDQVETLEHDLFFRQMVRICDATLRTNLYVRTKPADATVIKLSSAGVPGLGNPVPLSETFVFAPHVEGIHLRSAMVARGGIRYSDRRDDYRLEVLGLMKAQSVKNAVIVPHGAKGGFVLRGSHNSEADIQTAYDTYIEAILSITDNIVERKVIHPEIGRIYDGDDPYFVVAADKGTATFSDRANAIAVRMNFWLSDAFASGGSSGYDHKAIGITAKGAWVSVKHHFAKLGIDPEKDSISVVGIGDMNGDVFGNGMLLSRSMRLIGAFDHRDIFIDPNPDPRRSYLERERLFRLPRSSWNSYSSELISEGGGVFSRTLKSIMLSPQAAVVLGTLPGAYSPAEIVQSILRAPVDLIWNGGIGTYIRSSGETNPEIGDKTNDQVRISAAQVRVKVIGEGGNLGLSQPARIELAGRKVLLNTDAIDNSAGVDTSDHEVNLKILYQNAPSLAKFDRDELLNSVTEDVERLVLADNLWQNWSLTMAETEFDQMRGAYTEFITLLETRGGLSRDVEFVPSNDELQAGYTLKRPELSVLLAYEKLRLKEEFGRVNPASTDIFSKLAQEYFPLRIAESAAMELANHPLWPELVSNYLANMVVNIAGPTYMMRTVEESSHDVLDVAECFLRANEIFQSARTLRSLMDNSSPSFDQTVGGFLGTVRFHERATRWLLRDLGRAKSANIAQFRDLTTSLIENFQSVLPEKYRIHVAAGTSGTYDDIGQDGHFRLAELSSYATSIMEIAHLKTEFDDLDILEIARQYFMIGEVLVVPELLDAAKNLPRRTSWERQVRIAVRDDIDSVHAQAFKMIALQPTEKQALVAQEQLKMVGADIFATCIGVNAETGSFAQVTSEDLLAMLVVGTRRLRAAVEGH